MEGGAGKMVKTGVQKESWRRSSMAARIDIGRPPMTVNVTVPPVDGRTRIFQPAGEPTTESTEKGKPRWTMTLRTIVSTSVVFIG